MTANERGSQDLYNNDQCPKCGALFAAGSPVAPTFPVEPSHVVFCYKCAHTGPIKEWWDAFDKEFGNAR